MPCFHGLPSRHALTHFLRNEVDPAGRARRSRSDQTTWSCFTGASCHPYLKALKLVDIKELLKYPYIVSARDSPWAWGRPAGQGSALVPIFGSKGCVAKVNSETSHTTQVLREASPGKRHRGKVGQTRSHQLPYLLSFVPYRSWSPGWPGPP